MDQYQFFRSFSRLFDFYAPLPSQRCNSHFDLTLASFLLRTQSCMLIISSLSVIYLCHIDSTFSQIALVRDSSRDGWIEKIIKQKWSSGLFWAGGTAEKKNTSNCHKYATFWGGFFNFLQAKKTIQNASKNILMSALKSSIIDNIVPSKR